MNLQAELEQEVGRLKFIIESLYTAINASTVVLFDKNINTIAECGGTNTDFLEKSIQTLMEEAERSLSLMGLEDEKRMFILETGEIGLYACPIGNSFILMSIVQKNIEIETRKDAIYNASTAISKISKKLLKYAKAHDI